MRGTFFKFPSWTRIGMLYMARKTAQIPLCRKRQLSVSSIHRRNSEWFVGYTEISTRNFRIAGHSTRGKALKHPLHLRTAETDAYKSDSKRGVPDEDCL